MMCMSECVSVCGGGGDAMKVYQCCVFDMVSALPDVQCQVVTSLSLMTKW